MVKESCYYRKLTDLGKDEPPPSFIDTQVEHLLGEYLPHTFSSDLIEMVNMAREFAHIRFYFHWLCESLVKFLE